MPDMYDKVLSQSEVAAALFGDFLPEPSDLKVENVTYNSVTISWKDNASSEDNYRVERSTDPVSGYATIATLPAGVEIYQDSGVKESTTYFYRVSALKGSEMSAFSNTVSVTTTMKPMSAGDILAYWPLDQSSSDVTGHGWNLTLYNGPTMYPIVNTVLLHLLLDGSDDFASSPVMDPGNEFTISHVGQDSFRQVQHRNTDGQCTIRSLVSRIQDSCQYLWDNRPEDCLRIG